MISTVRRTIVRSLVVCSIAALLVPVASAAEFLWYPYNSKYGADGYDVVAYFSDNKPVKGKNKYVAEHGGLKWRFSSATNRDQFKADPARFVPQYGGYCAYAVSEGYQAFGDPLVWTVHNDRLFFNYNRPTQITWTKNKDERISNADGYWPKILAAN